MMWVTRNDRSYQYKSVRDSTGRVKVHYLGNAVPAEAARAFKLIDATMREERASAQVAWLVERAALDEAERVVIASHKRYESLAARAMGLAGFRRVNRGPWRKRRGAALAVADGAAPAGLPVEALPFSSQVIRPGEWPPDGPPVNDPPACTLDATAGARAIPLERELCRWVALALFDSYRADSDGLEAGAGLFTDAEPASVARADDFDRRRTRATRRLLAAAMALVNVQRLALPALGRLAINPSLGGNDPVESLLLLQLEGDSMKDADLATQSEANEAFEPTEALQPISWLEPGGEIDEDEDEFDGEDDVVTDYKSLGPTALMRLSQDGNREAFSALEALCVANGDPPDFYWGEISRFKLTDALQDRVSLKNLLTRACAVRDLEAARMDLALPSDGAVERIIVDKAALALVESQVATAYHLRADGSGHEAKLVNLLERRRDRADARLLSILEALSKIRRTNRGNVQVIIGDHNLNVQT